MYLLPTMAINIGGSITSIPWAEMSQKRGARVTTLPTIWNGSVAAL